MEKKGLFNPISKDFVDEILDDDNNIVKILIPSNAINYFEVKEFPIIRRHLADFVLNNSGYVKSNWEDDIKDIYKKIDVEI